MSDLGFLTVKGRVLACIADDPSVRLRDIASRLDITERSAYGAVKGLTEAGYVVKTKDGRRNRYEVQDPSLGRRLQQLTELGNSDGETK
jgi:DNA-binding MarR family transcriptional regulator